MMRHPVSPKISLDCVLNVWFVLLCVVSMSRSESLSALTCGGHPVTLACR
jgi:hypothetical protein